MPYIERESLLGRLQDMVARGEPIVDRAKDAIVKSIQGR